MTMPLLIVEVDINPDCLQQPPPPGSDVGRLACLLYHQCRDQPVRAIEAAAQVLSRQAKALSLCQNPPDHDRQFRVCVRIARRALAGTLGAGLPPALAQAQRFHRRDLWPAWALRDIPLAEIGDLLFYR